MKPLLVFLLTLALFIAAIALQAQTGSTFQGTVTDIDGTPIPGATIYILGTNDSTTADPNGSFALTGLRPKTYNVRISAIAMIPVEHEVQVRKGATAKLDIKLEEECGARERMNRVTPQRVPPPPPVNTNSTYGTLHGQVTDSAGAPIAGARVEIVGTTRGAITRIDGTYFIAGLRAGITTVRISSLGMKPHEQQVTMQAGTTTALNLALVDDTSSNGELVLMRTISRHRVEGQVSGKVDQIEPEEIQRTSTTTLNATILRESTSVNGSGGEFALRGGRANEASIKRDGIEVTDPAVGNVPTAQNLPAQTPNVSPAAADYAEVTSSGFDASYGNVLSGVVNTVTSTSQSITPSVADNNQPLTLSGVVPSTDPLHGNGNERTWVMADATASPSGLYENTFRATGSSPYSTFSIDVDNASYTNIRGYLSRGETPPASAVRIEELINYFKYDYPEPTGEHPFAFHSEVTACPWAPEHLILRLALQGRELHPEQAPPSNLVFLIDVSGSMSSPNKLALLKQGFLKLIDQLRPEDRVAIVVYAGAAGLVLKPTSGQYKATIKCAISKLQSGGSTAGGAGIKLAYKVARENFLPNGTNRVILATDGDFNVGISSQEGLVGLIEEERKGGVFLSVLGFGTGNYQDQKMEQLADNGNGNYYYIDKLSEAERVLVTEMSGTLNTIAKDVKLQIKFNPENVAAYRLIGYENRVLAAKDFDDDTKDAGELGAGHQVTALYEVVPVGAAVGYNVDQSKGEDYQLDEKRPELLTANDLLLARLRYKEPTDSTSKLIEHIVQDKRVPLESASEQTRFAMSVAQWGMLLRGSQYAGTSSLSSAEKLASLASGAEPNTYQKEFLELIEKSKKEL